MTLTTTVSVEKQ